MTVEIEEEGSGGCEGSLGGACWSEERSRSGAVRVLDKALPSSASWDVEEAVGPTAGGIAVTVAVATVATVAVATGGVVVKGRADAARGRPFLFVVCNPGGWTCLASAREKVLVELLPIPLTGDVAEELEECEWRL